MRKATLERNGSRTDWLWPRRKARREEAVIRQEEYDALSKDEKIGRALNRRGNSTKELKGLAV